jgi:hypothetical protein
MAGSRRSALDADALRSCRSMARALSSTMTVRDFESGCWYLDQLKNFAECIGIPAAKKLRKDELEKESLTYDDLVRRYVALNKMPRFGRVPSPPLHQLRRRLPRSQ